MGKNLMKYMGIKPVMALLAVLSLLQTMAIILQAVWLAKGISALFAGEPVKEQYGVGLLFLLAFICRHLLGLLQSKVAYRFAAKTAAELRRELMAKLFRLGPRFTSKQGSGSLVTLVLEGVPQFRTYLELFLPRMMQMGITPWIILAYVYYLDILSGVILTVTLPIMVIFLILVGLAAKKQTEGQLDSYRLLSNHFVDSLRGLETLKVLGKSRDHAESIKRVSDQYRKATMRTLRVAFLSTFALDFFTMLSVAVVAVNLGLRLINVELPLFPALTILILAPEYFLPTRMVGADFHATQNGKLSAERMEAILALPEASDEELAGKGASKAMSMALDIQPTDTISVDNIAVQYDADADADAEQVQDASLQGVSFTITHAMKVGIIGESGAGKTTLLDALGGFLPLTEGSVCLNGERISLTSSSWRNQATTIPQHPYLFYGTLADNVRFYVPDATDEQVVAAIEAAGLGALVHSLPQGIHELVGNGGRSLSGGQEQRVALARAYLSHRPVLLLDEPTAHLDIETEHELKETMLLLFEGKFVFLATHRLHWMANMDLILVMNQGELVELGTHQELLQRQGVYFNMLHDLEEELR